VALTSNSLMLRMSWKTAFPDLHIFLERIRMQEYEQEKGNLGFWHCKEKCTRLW